MWQPEKYASVSYSVTINRIPSMSTTRPAGLIYCPTDQEIAEVLSRDRFDHRAIRHYVLRQYEHDLRSQHGADDLPGGQVVSVEHVLPQKLNQEWEKKFTKDAGLAARNTASRNPHKHLGTRKHQWQDDAKYRNELRCPIQSTKAPRSLSLSTPS